MFEKISLERTMDFMVKQNIAGWNGMGHYGNKLFTLPRLAQAQKILDEAKSLAADDADAQERLSFLQIGLTHTVLTTETMNAFDASNADKGNQKLRQEFEASLAKLDQFRKQMPDPHAINIVMVNKLEMWSGWRAKNYEE